jgi:Thioredoxin domain
MVMHIRIVGPSDEQRHRLEKLTREVVAEMHLKPHFEVADPEGASASSPGAGPALLVDGALKASGRIPTRNEIGSWLRPHLELGR